MDLTQYITISVPTGICLVIAIFLLVLSIFIFIFSVSVGNENYITGAQCCLILMLVSLIPACAFTNKNNEKNISTMTAEIQKETGYTLPYESAKTVLINSDNYKSRTGIISAADKNGDKTAITFVRTGDYLDLYIAGDTKSLFPKSDTK